MIAGPRILACLPARGGSRRIPRKNIVEVGGRPVLAWAIDIVAASELCARIHVSTDDAEIAEVAAVAGHRPDFFRPAALADDFTGVHPVMLHALETYAARGEDFDTVLLFLPTALLIESADLRAGVALYERFGRDRPVIAVARYPAPVEWAFRRDEGGALTPDQPGMSDVRSQNLREAWYDSGTFAIFPAPELRRPFSDERYVGAEIGALKAIDVDTPADLETLRELFALRVGGGTNG